MGCSFLALLSLQVRYIEEMVTMRREQFDESVKRSLYNAAHKLELYETMRYLEKDALMCCHDAERVVLPSTLVDIPEGISHHLMAEITLAAHNPRYVLVDGYLIDTQV